MHHNMTTATETGRGPRISWYRTPISRDLLNELNQRSDWRGLVQTVGFLGVLTLTGAVGCSSSATPPSTSA